MINVIWCLGGAMVAALCVNSIVDYWHSIPLKEETSVPIYITKEIFLND